MPKPLLLPLALVFSSLAPVARADVPAWVDEPAFEKHCEQIRAAVGCPDCQCSAITQSNPTVDAAAVSDIPSAVLAELTGTSPDGAMTIHVLRAVLGSAERLFDGGTVLDLTTGFADPRTSRFEVVGSEQVMDMCPGACPHEPVGLVHAFELESVWVSGIDVTPDKGVETTTRQLALCFAPGEGAAPGCWLLPLGERTEEVKYDLSGEGKEKRGKKKGWSRTWKLSPGGEVQLSLGPVKGSAPSEIKQGPVGKAPKKDHLKPLTVRADVTAAKR